jgi:murein DD-endopeptidase MepM/ murein hydrolase activator NlpD
MRPSSAAPLECPRCQGPVDVKSRHVAVSGSAIKIYCSDACLRGLNVPKVPVTEEPVIVALEDPPRRWTTWLFAVVLVGGGTYAAVRFAGGRTDDTDDEVAVQPWTIPAPPAAAPPPAPPQPTPEQLAEEALLAELKQDIWIHPLAGPARRMPINHTAAFGAARSVDPPVECYSGHCGVDVGMNWGEPVHAAHEGVVDWVNRGPNEERGGVFVKIAHRNGTLFTWYFHLAAVPRWVQPGAKVALGAVIGLLGDTGIKRSMPHLHFAMTVKTKPGRERYIDPEPLIAIWPLWIPDDTKAAGHVSIIEPPGVPVKVPMPHKRRSAKAAPAAEGSPATGAPAEPAAEPAPLAEPTATGAASIGLEHN